MEPTTDETVSVAPAADTAFDASTLPVRVAGWMTTAERRLRVGGEWLLASALREGLELAAEELRDRRECVRDPVRATESRLARYGMLFDEVPVALLATDGSGRICEANRLASRLLGEPLGAEGRPLVRYVALEDRRAFRAALAALAATPDDVRELSLRLQPVGGRAVDVAATVRRPVRTGEEPVLCWAVRERRTDEDGDLL